MVTPKGPSLTDDIARAFARGFLHECGDEAVLTVDEDNEARRAAGDTGSCATHDHCDANEIMAAAFAEVMGREPVAASSEDAALITDAWAYATGERPMGDCGLADLLTDGGTKRADVEGG